MNALSKYLSPLLLIGISATTAQADCGNGKDDTAAVQPAAAYPVAALDEMNDNDARRSVGTAVDDSVITGKVKAALVGAEDIDAIIFDAETNSFFGGGGLIAVRLLILDEDYEEEAKILAGH